MGNLHNNNLKRGRVLTDSKRTNWQAQVQQLAQLQGWNLERNKITQKKILLLNKRDGA